jgi:hypothetical protein
MSLSLLGHHFWSSYWLVKARGGVVCASSSLMEPGLDDMAQRSLSDGPTLMDSRR